MTQASEQTALITGASAGIGRDLARRFATDGHHVALVARRRDRLAELASELIASHGINAHIIPADLADPKAPAAIVAEISALGAEIGFLVNNAGFGSNGAFIKQDLGREVEMVQVNVSALVELTGLVVPGMVARGRGRVLNIGSTAGFQAGPYMATYYASKAFVNHFSEALFHELKATGVTVTVSCPGPVATEFASIAGNDRSKLFAAKVASSEDIAHAAYGAMMKGQRMIVHGGRSKALIQAQRLMPRSVVHQATAKLNRKAD